MYEVSLLFCLLGDFKKYVLVVLFWLECWKKVSIPCQFKKWNEQNGYKYMNTKSLSKPKLCTSLVILAFRAESWIRRMMYERRGKINTKHLWVFFCCTVWVKKKTETEIQSYISPNRKEKPWTCYQWMMAYLVFFHYGTLVVHIGWMAAQQ